MREMTANDEPFERLLSRAEAGDAEAQFEVGLRYERGDGVPELIGKALHWYCESANRGCVRAQLSLGCLYHTGEAGVKDMAQARDWYARAAQGGSASAWNNLGLMYRQGDGVAQDHAKALELFRKAVELGDVPALNNLALAYKNGEGLPKDPRKAAGVFRRAADKGSVEAACNLAAMCERGDGVPQDLALAREYYRLAAERGDADAARALERLASPAPDSPEGGRVQLDYRRGRPAWFLKAPRPGRLREARHALHARLFRMPTGALVSVVLKLFDAPEQPFFAHRVMDLGDPEVVRHVKACVEAAELIVAFESVGEEPGFERALPVPANRWRLILSEGRAHNAAVSADGRKALEDFLEVFRPASRLGVDAAWEAVERAFPAPAAKAGAREAPAGLEAAVARPPGTIGMDFAAPPPSEKEVAARRKARELDERAQELRRIGNRDWALALRLQEEALRRRVHDGWGQLRSLAHQALILKERRCLDGCLAALEELEAERRGVADDPVRQACLEEHAACLRELARMKADGETPWAADAAWALERRLVAYLDSLGVELESVQKGVFSHYWSFAFEGRPVILDVVYPDHAAQSASARWLLRVEEPAPPALAARLAVFFKPEAVVRRVKPDGKARLQFRADGLLAGTPLG